MANKMHVCAETGKDMLPDSDLSKMEVCDVVMLDPIRGWRIWESKHPREDYNEFSEARFHFHPVCKYMHHNIDSRLSELSMTSLQLVDLPDCGCMQIGSIHQISIIRS